MEGEAEEEAQGEKEGEAEEEAEGEKEQGWEEGQEELKGEEGSGRDSTPPFKISSFVSKTTPQWTDSTSTAI